MFGRRAFSTAANLNQQFAKKALRQSTPLNRVANSFAEITYPSGALTGGKVPLFNNTQPHTLSEKTITVKPYRILFPPFFLIVVPQGTYVACKYFGATPEHFGMEH